MVVSNGPPLLDINAQHYSNDSYLLQVKRDNLTVETIFVLRILINVSEMNLTSNQTSLTCQTDSILHQSDLNSVASMNRVEPDYLPFAMLYGIKGWEGY